MRYMLKWLLMYKGFMFEARGRGISWQTKVWAVLVKREFPVSVQSNQFCDFAFVFSLRKVEHAFALQFSGLVALLASTECQGHNDPLPALHATFAR